MSLRSPMGQALGKGAARGAVQHWWMQRVTAVALVPLTLWFLWSLTALPAHDYDTVRDWVAAGWTPVGLALLVICTAWHSALGLQVVIEDYVPGHGSKTVCLLLANFAHAIAGAAALIAILKVAL
jgi:succinate dehydrogenase / fumarate reductase membrane anchor subunit